MDTLLNWLWQGGVVAIAALGMLRLLDRAGAAARCVVCWVALTVIAVLPLLAFGITALSPAATGPVASAAIVTVPAAWWTSGAVAAAALAFWAGIHTIRLVHAIVQVRRARTCAQLFPPAIEPRLGHWARVRTAGRAARLVLSERVQAAAVFGCGGPVIAVAPALVDRLDASELDRVVIHEWAHVQRRDDIAKLAQVLVRAVAGWHPAVWWLDRRLSIEQELACDEMVVAISGGAKAYASCLVKLATFRNAHPDALLATGALSSTGLGRRVARLLAPKTLASPALARTSATLVIAILCVLAFRIAPVSVVEAAVSATVARVLRPSAQTEPAPVVAAVGQPADRRTAAGGRRAARAPGRSSETVTAATQVIPEAAAPPRADADVPAIEEPLPHDPTSEAPVRTEPDLPPAVVTSTASPSPPPVANAESASVWSPAADAGTALGRKSKEAGVATGSAFTRFAKKIAGSF